MHDKSNIFISFLLINYFIYFILITNISCSYGRFSSSQVVDRVLKLKKGDLVSIILTDNTQINGVFLKQEKGEIAIAQIENGIIKQRLIKINSISKIRKLCESASKQPNVLVEIGLFLVILGLILFMGLNSAFFP